MLVVLVHHLGRLDILTGFFRASDSTRPRVSSTVKVYEVVYRRTDFCVRLDALRLKLAGRGRPLNSGLAAVHGWRWSSELGASRNDHLGRLDVFGRGFRPLDRPGLRVRVRPCDLERVWGAGVLEGQKIVYLQGTFRLRLGT